MDSAMCICNLYVKCFLFPAQHGELCDVKMYMYDV